MPQRRSLSPRLFPGLLLASACACWLGAAASPGWAAPKAPAGHPKAVAAKGAAPAPAPATETAPPATPSPAPSGQPAGSAAGATTPAGAPTAPGVPAAAMPTPSPPPAAPSAAAAPAAPTTASAQPSSTIAPGEPLRVLLRRFTDALALEGVGSISPDNARHLSVAVLPFFEHGARSKRYDLGALLTYSVRAALITDYGLLVVPSEAVRVALKKLPPDRPPGPEQAVEIGRALKADVVVSGNISDGGDHFAIQASVLDVQGKAAPVEHRVVRVGVREMIEAAENAQVLRTQLGALWRSALLPGWGQIYNRQLVKGVMVAGTEAALLSTALVFQILGSRAEARYDWHLRETVDQRSAAEESYRSRNILLGLAAAFWVYGALDAYLSGRDPDELPSLSLGDSGATLGLGPLPPAPVLGGSPDPLGMVALVSWGR